eukprot:TRINITY_DN22589_c0_g1_i1.p1 TRINITY_DN22589_c0_g1~~TRINITY_DN22589_c0_g1_i1.p1  ORF type:complete len:386 (+),score=118.21 TRINITY_DN22589_c0_g1_i1:72-1160(+)
MLRRCCAVLCGPAAAAACSLVTVDAGDGSRVIGRTLESASPADGYVPWQLTAVPEGAAVRSAPECPGSDPFPVRHGYVAMTLPVIGHAFDGLNAAGLAVSEHTLRQSQYQEQSAGPAPRICHLMVVSWALASFGSVREMAAGLGRVRVVASAGYNSGDGMHWAAQDASGDSAVFEYLNGALRISNNTVGVMTNDPDFEWQLRNLNNYVAISNDWPRPGQQLHTAVGQVPAAVGHGANLLGLPGDASPPGRFVRLFYLRSMARTPRSFDEAMVLTQSLLNSVFVIDGTVSEPHPRRSGYDRTMWATMKSPAQGLFMLRSYSSMQWLSVRLAELDLGPGHEVRMMPVPVGVSSVDVSHRLKGAR